MKKLVAISIVAMTLLVGGLALGQSSRFSDVEDNKWYSEAVAWADREAIMNGTSDTTFSPNGTLTRAQMVTILYRYHEVSEAQRVQDLNDLADIYASTTTTAPAAEDSTSLGTFFAAAEFSPPSVDCNLEAYNRYTDKWQTQSAEGWRCKTRRFAASYYAIVGLNIPTEGNCVAGPQNAPFNEAGVAIVQASHDELTLDAYCYSTGETYPVSTS